MKWHSTFALAILLLLLLLFVATLSAQEKNRSTTFFSKNPETIFLGAVMSKKSLNTEKHIINDHSFDDKVMALSFELKYEFPEFVPTKDNMYSIIKEQFDRQGLPAQTGGASTYSLSTINALNDINLLFGQTMNLQKWFGLNDAITPAKSIILIKYDVPFFNLYLDSQNENFFKLQRQIKELNDEDLFIVNSLTWGRRAVVVIQSNFEEQVSKGAIYRYMQNKPLSEQDSVIIETANYSYTVFDDVDLKLEDNNPIQAVEEYITGPISKENFGRVLDVIGMDANNGAFIENEYD